MQAQGRFFTYQSKLNDRIDRCFCLGMVVMGLGVLIVRWPDDAI